MFLSNGPGDPSATRYGVGAAKELLGKVPIFGICLGHQLLALALGGSTYKMKFGHRGVNQPVENRRSGAVEITSHNHGFAVDPGAWTKESAKESSATLARGKPRKKPGWMSVWPVATSAGSTSPTGT